MDVTLQTLLSFSFSVILHYNTLDSFNHKFGTLNKHFDTKNSLSKDHEELLRTFEVSAVLMNSLVVTITFLALKQLLLHVF